MTGMDKRRGVAADLLGCMANKQVSLLEIRVTVSWVRWERGEYQEASWRGADSTQYGRVGQTWRSESRQGLGSAAEPPPARPAVLA